MVRHGPQRGAAKKERVEARNRLVTGFPAVTGIGPRTAVCMDSLWGHRNLIGGVLDEERIVQRPGRADDSNRLRYSTIR
jgi:hypothetical protein